MLESGDELQMLDSSTHSYCGECYEEHIKALEREDTLFRQNKTLKALEIFSGSFPVLSHEYTSNILKVPVVSQSGWRNRDSFKPNGQSSMRRVLRRHFSKSRLYNQ
jgi:hypothetical protein